MADYNIIPMTTLAELYTVP